MSRRLFLLLGMTALMTRVGRPDAVETEVKTSSPFKDFALTQVADGHILENRQGASLSPQIEGVQTCFVIKASPSTVGARILNWDPVGKKDLDVSTHRKLPASISPEVFEKSLAPIFQSSGNDANWIVKQSNSAKDPSCELLLTADEKARLAAATTPDKLTKAWSAVLTSRASDFRAHGAPDFHSLLGALKSFGSTASSGPPGDAIYYWEIGDVSKHTKLSEDVSWQDASAGSTRVIDGEFFVTSEYTASLNVSRLWPVTVEGKPATLVWRIDLAFANQFADQNGAERIASAGLILSSTKKTIKALQDIKK